MHDHGLLRILRGSPQALGEASFKKYFLKHDCVDLQTGEYNLFN
jgi:hypothetical protein